jgi:hypothetical protein
VEGVNKNVCLGKITPREIICDRQLGESKTLEQHLKMGVIAADKRAGSVNRGIDLVKSKLQVQEDGKPRIYVCRTSLAATDMDLYDAKQPTCLAEEMGAYIWDPKRPDEPVDKHNHALDGLRYLTIRLFGAGLWEAPSASPASLRAEEFEPTQENVFERPQRLRFGGKPASSRHWRR